MKRLLLLFTLFLLSQEMLAQSDSDRITGIWLSENEKAHIEIFKRSDHYFGKLVRLEETADSSVTSDRDRSDPTFDKDAIIGTIILSDISYKNGEWHGKLYLPKKDRKEKCTLELLSENELKISVSHFLFSSSKTWTRL